MSIKIFTVVFSLLLLYGCSRVALLDDCDVNALIADRIQKKAQWSHTSCEDAICYLLGKELAVESAVQIALLNNPDVQAIYDEIGIARADLVEAGLFRNPVFDGYVRFPDRNGLILNTQFSIAQTFLDIFLVPLKKKVAAAELAKTKLHVAHVILNLAFDVQETFYLYVALQQQLALQELLSEAHDVAFRLAILQKQQGNINELELQARNHEYLQAKIRYAECKATWMDVRERMNQLMGLEVDTCWSALQNLPPLPECEMSCESLETVALSKRLDLGVGRWEMERLIGLLKTKRWWAFADGTLGISSEQEAENFLETGPTWTIPLPFFNYGQAERARLSALYSQSSHRLKALEIAILSQVRSARAQLTIYRELVKDYQCQLLPLQQAIVLASQRYYNFMALDVYKLIGAKQQEIEMEIHYTQALLHYWQLRVDLDRALGGNLEWAVTQRGT